MQPITWTREEIQVRVSEKMAALKRIRAPTGTSLDERLQAVDRAEARLATERISRTRGGAPQIHLAEVDPVMHRAVEPDTDSDDRPRGYGAADDSFGSPSTSTRRIGDDKVNLLQVKGNPEKAFSAKNVNLDDEQHRLELKRKARLLGNVEKQSKADWVVLDRLSALAVLKDEPNGITLVKLAERLLDDRATPADTRRLSAMMKREEDRGWVDTGGRGKPLQLTDFGRSELAAITEEDMARARTRTLEDRQSRIERQRKRLACPKAKRADK